MNNEVYEYTVKQTNRIKNKFDKKDVQQQVMLVLIEKKLHTEKLEDWLQNYIKGIIWNVSTTLHNQFNQDTYSLTTAHNLLYDESIKVDYIEDRPDYKELISKIKLYVFNTYFSKGKSMTKWKVWYLVHRNWDYKDIATRLNISYRTAIEYQYQALQEIKDKVLWK